MWKPASVASLALGPLGLGCSNPVIPPDRSTPDGTPNAFLAAESGSGRIVFASAREDGFDIWVMNADGSDPIQLTSLPGPDLYPAWSPDGKRIAFASYPPLSGPIKVCVMNADGTGLIGLAQGDDPTWSPDGKRIAFVKGGGEIYVMNANGTGQTNLTNHPAFDTEPHWSPDGRQIAFKSDRDGNDEIYVMNADGTNPTRLTNAPASSDGAPDWSPDGNRIAFHRVTNFEGEIYVMNADGTGQTNLTNHPRDDRHPAWSPDGTRIVFSSDRDQPGVDTKIYVMNADGSMPTRLTDENGPDDFPDWSKCTSLRCGPGSITSTGPAPSTRPAGDLTTRDNCGGSIGRRR